MTLGQLFKSLLTDLFPAKETPGGLPSEVKHCMIVTLKMAKTMDAHPNDQNRLALRNAILKTREKAFYHYNRKKVMEGLLSLRLKRILQAIEKDIQYLNKT